RPRGHGREVRHRGGFERRAPAELGVGFVGTAVGNEHHVLHDTDGTRRGRHDPRPFYPPRVVPPPTVWRRARRSVVALLMVFVSVGGAASRAGAASKPPRVDLKLVTGLAGATALATRPDDPALYVATQDGKVFAVRSVGEPTIV